MGMGAYDEDEQEKRQPDFDEDEDDSEVITLQDERQDGEVKSETPDDVNEMMENFRENTADD